MPLLKRPLEPANVTRTVEGKIPSNIRNELEYVANTTQANLIRQLSSLSHHAEDMFRELFQEATSIYNRTCRMTEKVDRLKDSVRMFDPNKVDIKLTDITKKKPYKTDYHFDQQICVRESIPVNVKHMYEKCAPCPRLDKFDKFRPDKIPSIKTYTDPSYFGQLWFESVQKNLTEKQVNRSKVKKRPSKKGGKSGRVINPDVKDRTQKYAGRSMGTEFMEPKPSNDRSGPMSPSGSSDQSEPPPERQSYMTPPPPVPTNQAKTRDYQDMVYDSIDPQEQLRMQQRASHHQNHHMSMSGSPSMHRMTIAPPPPPPAMDNSQQNFPPPFNEPDLDIVPPPPTGHDLDLPRPASPPPPLDHQPYIPPPPSQMSPSRQSQHMPIPPPPPPGLQTRESFSPPAPRPPQAAGAAIPPPPPPPPPPPGTSGIVPLAPPPAASNSQVPSVNLLTQAAAGLRNTEDSPKPVAVKDERSALLEQIRIGFKLKESEKNTTRNEAPSFDKKATLGGAFDVTSIMDKIQQMRTAMENSDDSGSEDEFDWSDDDSS